MERLLECTSRRRCVGNAILPVINHNQIAQGSRMSSFESRQHSGSDRRVRRVRAGKAWAIGLAFVIALTSVGAYQLHARATRQAPPSESMPGLSADKAARVAHANDLREAAAAN